MKKIMALFLILISVSGSAQDTASESKSFWNGAINDQMMPLYLASALVLVVFILVLVVTVYLIRVLNMFASIAEREKMEKLGITFVPKPSWFDTLSQRLNASVPLSQEKDIDMGHSYDGIRELDNHLPPWWKWLFIGTIVWAAIYVVVFHITDTLPLSIEEYQNEVAKAEVQKKLFNASQPQTAIDETTLAYTRDAAIIAKGQTVFLDNNCAACHRADGGGNTIGPNLTDEYWIHGGGIRNIFKTIKDGAVEKGMPAWGKSMSPQSVRDVSFYIMSLQGTKPANAKASQGELYIEKTIPVSDSTKVQAAL